MWGWALIVFGATLLLFVTMILGQSEEAREMIEMLVYLYTVIYPYQLNTNVLLFIGTSWIWVISVFVFFVLLVGHAIKYNTFKIMVVFSYFIMVFTTFYLIANVLCYLIPPLQWAVFSIPGFMQFMVFMYGVLPFTVLVLILMFLLTIYDYRERKESGRDARTITKKMGPRTMAVMKYTAVLGLIIFALCAILLAV